MHEVNPIIKTGVNPSGFIHLEDSRVVLNYEPAMAPR
jgi:hypothetical protein